MKKIVFAILAVAALVCACNTKENLTPDQKVIPFKATVQLNEDVITHAVAESGGKIVSSFAQGEEIALIYQAGGSAKKTDVTIESIDGSGKATIAGSLNASVIDGTPVTLIYPAIAANSSTGDINPSMLSSQKGALAIKNDIRKGTGTIKVDGSATLAGGATLDAVFAICKFTVKDIDGSNELSVSSFVVKDADNNVITTVTPDAATSTLYVSLPTSSDLFWFEAVAADKPYVAKGTAAITAGNFYTPTIKMATIFNVIGTDGKFYKDKAAAVAAGTSASAIIGYLGSDTAETGFEHGLAIAMRNATNGTLGTMRWRESGSGTNNPDQYLVVGDALTAKESGRTLGADKNNDTFPAFKCAVANVFTTADGISNVAPAGTSGWFLASAHQWNLLIKSFSGQDTDLTTGVNNNMKSNTFTASLTSAGFAYSGLTENYYWVSSENNASYAWRYETANGRLYTSNKTNYNAVRATLAF